MPSSLPQFERPPVVETVLGVQFDPIKGFRNAHLGAFWKNLGEDWSQPADAPFIRPQSELFGEAQRWTPAGLQLEFTRELAVRLQVTNRSGDRLIQLQNGRFHYNWVGLDGGPYPSYDGVQPEFDKAFSQLRSFLEANDLNHFHPNQWEATYVNHIPKGTVWNNAKDWAQMLPGLLESGGQFSSVSFESFSGEWHFEIPPQTGRLHIQLKHAITEPLADTENAEKLILTLTARGPINEECTLDDGLNAGHEAIVRTFYECVSEDARQYWGVKNADT